MEDLPPHKVQHLLSAGWFIISNVVDGPWLWGAHAGHQHLADVQNVAARSELLASTLVVPALQTTGKQLRPCSQREQRALRGEVNPHFCSGRQTHLLCSLQGAAAGTIDAGQPEDVNRQPSGCPET